MNNSGRLYMKPNKEQHLNIGNHLLFFALLYQIDVRNKRNTKNNTREEKEETVKNTIN